jgi:hypothetical protein
VIAGFFNLSNPATPPEWKETETATRSALIEGPSNIISISHVEEQGSQPERNQNHSGRSRYSPPRSSRLAMAPRPSRFQTTSRSCSSRHARPNRHGNSLQHADAPHPLALLRARRDRPRDGSST